MSFRSRLMMSIVHAVVPWPSRLSYVVPQFALHWPHWLDVPDRVKYKLGLLMYRCQHDQAPRYLMDHCSPVSDVVLRQRLRSAATVINFPCHAAVSAHTAVGRFLLLAPDCLKFTARRPRESGMFCGHLQTVAEDILVLAVLVCPAH